MTVNRTTLLDLPLPVTGTESGTWGDTTNNGLTEYLDIAIAGALSITSSVTLATTEGNSSSTGIVSTTAQYRTLIVPASGPSANIVITAPSSNRTYHVINRNATYTVQVRAGANSGVTIGVNQSSTVGYDSVAGDYVLVGPIGPTVPVSSGGTGQTSYAVGDLLYASTSTALSKLADVATGNALISGGVGVAPSYGKIGLTTHVSGTLPVDSGGTGATTLTANNVILGNGTSAVQFVAPGSNGNVLTSNGTTWTSSAGLSFATPLTVVGNATAGSEIRLPEDTDNGSNYAAVKAPDSLASNVTLTLPSQTATLGYINIPQSGSAKTTAYTLATGDVGEFIEVGSGGSITIPDATFSAGDAVLVFNNTSGGITITCTITTAYIAGTDTDKATVTLATRGIASILFASGTVCVISGNVS